MHSISILGYTLGIVDREPELACFAFAWEIPFKKSRPIGLTQVSAKIYFSDFAGIPSSLLEAHGALDVSLINDLPLFIDPFLLFNSAKPEYQALHSEILNYMRFLKSITLAESASPALVNSLFAFPEVKQNWLGFSKSGNAGRGLGRDFAASLHTNFKTLFRNFGEEKISSSSHIEKLCLVRDGIGRDMISDFTTNLIKGFLGKYTEDFARKYLEPHQVRRVTLAKVRFNYDTRSWSPETFDLPYLNGDFILLTPKDILTKDESWINRNDLYDRFIDIASSIPDDALRTQLNSYLQNIFPSDVKKNKEDFVAAVSQAIVRYPEVLDYYIKDKEENSEQAAPLSESRVEAAQKQFIEAVRSFVQEYLEPYGFYQQPKDTYEEARKRVLFLKDVIENKGGHRIFYVNDEPIEREADLQILYRLTWYATISDITREANDGRGPVDFKASRGSSDKTLIEVKLAKNTHLERNLEKQLEIYEKASDATRPSIKVIIYFTADQLARVERILQKLKLERDSSIILIDARPDNKPSGSKA